MGYHRAGFDVIGVDKEPQPNYPFPFIQADAVEYLLEHGREYDAIHASPPCQVHSTITPDRTVHEDLIPPTRTALLEVGGVWVMENVEGAKRALVNPMRLCGSSFGLRVRRHRWFESSVWLTSIPCDHASQGEVVGVYGSHGDRSYTYLRPDGTGRGKRAANVDEAREVMGMPWASWYGCTQAIPPVYTEWIGHQLIQHLQERAA